MYVVRYVGFIFIHNINIYKNDATNNLLQQNESPKDLCCKYLLYLYHELFMIIHAHVSPESPDQNFEITILFS